MKKMVAGAFVGLTIIILGIFVWYVYMTTFIEQGNHSLFALSLIQIGIGVYILFKASSSSDQKIQTDDMGLEITKEKKDFENVLQRNNTLMNEWHKTADMKDKMTVLKIASNEESKKV